MGKAFAGMHRILPGTLQTLAALLKTGPHSTTADGEIQVRVRD